MVGPVREAMEDEGFAGDVSKITSLGEEDVGVELGTAVKERRDRFEAVLRG
jgi:hypothetical protein